MNTKVIEYLTKREIAYLPIIGKYVAFKEIVTTEGKSYINQGITQKSVIDEVTSTKVIKHEHNLFMFPKSFAEEINKKTFPDWEQEFEKLYINKPYDAIEQGNDVVLLTFKSNDHTIRDLDDNLMPVAMFFDYIQGHITNDRYDLNEVYKILQDRNDIEFILDKKKKEGVIKDIPYYNADLERFACIEFIWHPTTEDFNTIREQLKKRHTDRWNIIRENIFKFPKKERNNVDVR